MAAGEVPAPERVLSIVGLARLLAVLRDDGYQLVAPTVRDGAIVHGEISGVEDLPAGWTATQEAGRYRLTRRSDGALFGYAAGPQSWRQHFFVPRSRLFRVRRRDGGLQVDADAPEPPRLALIGARACDLHAIEVQDRAFLGAVTEPDSTCRR